MAAKSIDCARCVREQRSIGSVCFLHFIRRRRLVLGAALPGRGASSALGPPPNMPRRLAPEWIRNFKIYFLPRPWPLWMLWIKPGLRPINLQAWILSLVAMMMIGGASIYRGLRTLNTGTAQNSISNHELAQV